MRDDPRYHEGLRLFRAREWFEAHEVLEALWRELPKGDDREYVQGLIQLAVSLEHWRRGNPRGAWGQWTKARARLDPLPPVYGGLALGELLADFAAWWSAHDLDAAVAAQARGEASVPALGEGVPTPRWAPA